MFAPSAITPQKGNRFGWNLEHCEHIVGSEARQILGAIRAVKTVWDWEAAKIVFYVQVNNARFHRFPIRQSLRHLNTTTSIGEEVKLLEQNFENFAARCRFLKCKNCLQNFLVLRFQAAITPQWLQIAGNSLQKWPSTGCVVFIFTVRINSKSFRWAVRSVQETHLPKFSATSDVRYCLLKPIVRRSTGAAWRPIYERKADWIEN